MIVDNQVYPLLNKIAKLTKEVSLAEFRPESDENSNVSKANQKTAKLSGEIDKNLKRPHLEVEANDFVSKTEKESHIIRYYCQGSKKVLKIILQRMMVRNIPVYVYYGGYDMNSKPVGIGSLSYKFDSTDSKYKIELIAEAMGWAKIFLRRPISLSSEGYVSG